MMIYIVSISLQYAIQYNIYKEYVSLNLLPRIIS